VPVLLLVISALGLSIFKTHAWPGGPVSFGALAMAAAWLQGIRSGGDQLISLAPPNKGMKPTPSAGLLKMWSAACGLCQVLGASQVEWARR
jgi:hypothetical protein